MPLGFSKFLKIARGSNSDIRGTGLGLAISKGLVEAHGGEIGMRSRDGGPGSVFWFSLPALAPA